MNDAIHLIVNLIMLALGAGGWYVLVHRPDRAANAAAHAEALAQRDEQHAAEVKRLTTKHRSDMADARADLAKSDGLLTSAVFRAECAETKAAAFEVALGFATLRVDGVASLDAARLARGRA